MWQTFVLPLFYAAFELYKAENYPTNKKKLFVCWKKTFKAFMLIPVTTSTEFVVELIGRDFEQMIEDNHEEAQRRWELRKNFRGVCGDSKSNPTSAEASERNSQHIL